MIPFLRGQTWRGHMTGSDAVCVDGHADVPSKTSVLTAAMETDASTVRCLFLVYRQDRLEVLWLSLV